MLALELQGPVGIITMNRPERHNAFDDTLIAELTRAIAEMDAHHAVRVLVLSATGKSFSAGADLNWMKRMAGYSHDENLRDATALGELMRTLNGTAKPTVARVQGNAFGGGVGLVACCDIAVATQNVVFALSEARLGLIPAVISPYVIAAIGARAARRYFQTAERFDAAEAYRIGLIHELVMDEAALDDKVGELVDALLASGPCAMARAKGLVGALGGRRIDSELIAFTASEIAQVRASAEGREGVSAFLEKRTPAWVMAQPGGEASGQ
jgi:methylglutaconyl-CoA hydratase